MFREVKKEETFPQIEERVLGLWDKDESFKKSLDSRPETEPYTFYDGPPFAFLRWPSVCNGPSALRSLARRYHQGHRSALLDHEGQEGSAWFRLGLPRTSD